MNFAEFHFLRPWWLLALIPAALLVLFLIKRVQSRGNWLEVCDPELLPFLLEDKPKEKRSYSLVVGSLACLLTIIALAGPTWQRLPSPAFRNESALVIALDLSPSMDASDIKPSRIAKARFKMADLLKQRKDGQTALLVYGGDAFTVTPLTSDTATIASQLEALNTDIMPSPGTNTGNAIRKAADLLLQAGVAQGHILLVSDGVDADSAALDEQWLRSYQLSVLAVGTIDGAPIQQPGGGFVKDRNGNIIIPRLDVSNMATLAEKGKGLYQAVTAGDDDVDRLSKFFSNVSGEGKNEVSNLLLTQWDEKGPWLLLLVLPWAALRFRKGLLLWIGICLLPFPKDSQALDWQGLWKTPNQRAEQAFKQQQYQQAADEFESPDWRAAAQYKAGQYQQAAETLKNAQTADQHYNRGNALAQAGQLKEALQAYNQALKLDPAHADAKYNKELIEKKQEEQQQQKQQDQDKKDQEQKQNQQNQDSQKSDQQSDQKQDQKSEQENQADQKDKQSQQEQDRQQRPEDKQKSADEKNKKEAAENQQHKADEGKKDEKQKANELEKDEIERANQQLLKRIPDEPTGLLKRKFKYQYSQRGKTAPASPNW